jgi:lysophospholipase L1-like esterase
MKLLLLLSFGMILSHHCECLSQTSDASSFAQYFIPVKETLHRKWPENRTVNIVFHGHSVPAGYFNTPHVNTLKAYPHQALEALKNTYPYAVINVITTAIGGENSEQGCERFENEVLALRPDVLFIDYALNDRTIGLDRAKKAWEYMILGAQKRNIKIALLTPTPDLAENILDDNAPLEKHAAQIRRLAAKHQTGLVDCHAAFKEKAGKGENLHSYMSQNNHPNARGHQMIANLIASLLIDSEPPFFTSDEIRNTEKATQTECGNDLIDLSGRWQIALDSADHGIDERWFAREFSDFIQLPGTLCDGGYGHPCSLPPSMEKDVFLNLKRKYDYVGIAWYRKTVNIPCDWKNKTVMLHLERVLWHSMLWVDGIQVEQNNESLVAPHQFDLTDVLTPGCHTLALRIDNRKQHDISVRDMCHAYTNETQTMWNGILGQISLHADEKISIDAISLSPDVDSSAVHVALHIKNRTNRAPEGKIIFRIREKNGPKLPDKEIFLCADTTLQHTPSAQTATIVFDYKIEKPQLWDEFAPNLYEVEAEWQTAHTSSVKKSAFGMRKLTNKDALLQINDRRIFLRGTLECCIFPLTGYPPTNTEDWIKTFRTAREYGLNHLRFHSWCPPEAAFRVADSLGFYLQVELPLWTLNIGDDPATVDFLFSEADKMITAYGNHPSFCFWSMGNELQGDFTIIDSLLVSLKQRDNRRLYTTTTFTFEKGRGRWPEPHDDFWVSQWTKHGWIRGQGIFDDQPARFDKDYSAAIDSLPLPIITHEIGQYSVYPNLREIDKYTGNLIPLNLIAVKNDLERKGRLHYADRYLQASGHLATILYKEEIERALKTPGLSGFQLLDLHDFPGQGTALVGLLDAFWESKGLIASQQFRSFCAPVVPLVRYAKATYTNDETLHVEAEVANFSRDTLENVVPAWTLVDSKGKAIATGKLPRQSIATGNAIALGAFAISLANVEHADCLSLTLTLQSETNTWTNTWSMWVYPQMLADDEGNVVYTRCFDEARAALQAGKNVLLNPRPEDIKGLEGKFVQVFWSPVHFPNQPGTMGILCDPAHPALAHFPTEMHANWQWWDICKNARTMALDSLPSGDTSIVGMTDNFFKNRRLALIFESRVGQGKLIVCSADLDERIDERPVARQLRHSLIRYMQSPAFMPAVQTTFDQIESQLASKKNTR